MQHTSRQSTLPRFCRDFVGIGHQLEQRRKQRRRIEMEERAVANRVLFLEKQQFKAQKNLIKKRDQLSSMMQIAQRQVHENSKKERMLLQRQRQLQLAKQQNHLRRMTHRQNLDRSERQLASRNSLDYKIGKMKLVQGQKQKRIQKREELISRRERYMSLNASRDLGRSKIDKFFKTKNAEHTNHYKEQIRKEQKTMKNKEDTIKKLAQIQDVMRKKLQQSSMRVSQMDQILGDITTSLKDRSHSRISLNQTLDRSPNNRQKLHNSPSLITSVQGQLLGLDDDIQERIQHGTMEVGGASQGGKVRKRRRNKHANRYRQYEIF